MTQVNFYQLTEQDGTGFDASPMAVLACELVSRCYGEKKRLTRLSWDQARADVYSGLLWQHPPERFIAHNIAGEGPQGGAPVEVTWGNQSAIRSIVVNLAALQIPNPERYHTIYDFVPVAEADKISARQRYAWFKRAGCQMAFFNASDITNV